MGTEGIVVWLKQHPCICLEELRKTIEESRQDNLPLRLDLKPGYPEHEGMLPSRPQR
jgi:hypothetical protein